jgi:hypothetical protein
MKCVSQWLIQAAETRPEESGHWWMWRAKREEGRDRAECG